MNIAYINKGKAKKLPENDKLLKAFQDRDIRLFVNKYKSVIASLKISEVDFIARLRKRLVK